MACAFLEAKWRNGPNFALEAVEEVFVATALSYRDRFSCGHALPDACHEILTVSVGGVLTPQSEWKMRPGSLRCRTAEGGESEICVDCGLRRRSPTICFVQRSFTTAQ